jgi:hypothetical protein
MMEWHINDLSLGGQFADPLAFRTALEPLLRLRLRNDLLRDRLYCSCRLHERRVTATADLRQAIFAISDQNFKRLVLEWFTKSGPFWNDNRQPNTDDFFLYETQEVTDQGLGEAARRRLAGTTANAFSFMGSPFRFDTSPLTVLQGLPECPIDTIYVDNHWTIDQLETASQSLVNYRSWHDVLTEINRRFGGLILSGDAGAALLPIPFSRPVTKRILELLHVLNSLVRESDQNGGLSQAGMMLYDNHFVGEEAWFSDESTRNKNKFGRQMTFSHPDHPATKIFCPWHGKIKTPQIRIHFEWPRPVGQRQIRIFYIGPKITKG